MKLTDAAKALGLSADDVVRELISGDLELDEAQITARVAESNKIVLEQALEEADSEYHRVDAAYQELGVQREQLQMTVYDLINTLEGINPDGTDRTVGSDGRSHPESASGAGDGPGSVPVADVLGPVSMHHRCDHCGATCCAERSIHDRPLAAKCGGGGVFGSILRWFRGGGFIQ